MPYSLVSFKTLIKLAAVDENKVFHTIPYEHHTEDRQQSAMHTLETKNALQMPVNHRLERLSNKSDDSCAPYKFTVSTDTESDLGLSLQVAYLTVGFDIG